jgi:2-methylcitrate dehydratase
MTQIKSDQRREEPHSAVERIGTFHAEARWEDLTGDVRRLFKRNILDCLGCAIAALPDSPFQALREQFEEYRAPGRCTLIGGGKTSPALTPAFNDGWGSISRPNKRSACAL